MPRDQRYSQKGGHRWRILELPIASFSQDGALRAVADIVERDLDIVDTGAAILVSPATLTTIQTFTAVAASTVKQIRVSGGLPCRVDLVKNTVTIEEAQMTSIRNVLFDFSALPLLTADVLEVKIFQEFTGKTPRYRSTLYGYLN